MASMLDIYASVTANARCDSREQFIAYLQAQGIEPLVHNNTVEFRAHGDREQILALARRCENFQAHYIHIARC